MILWFEFWLLDYINYEGNGEINILYKIYVYFE